jgi:hypothetical protein
MVKYNINAKSNALLISMCVVFAGIAGGLIGNYIQIPSDCSDPEDCPDPEIPNWIWKSDNECVPTIDGVMEDNEFWQNAENVHASQLKVDENHTDAYNFVYTERTEDSLLVCMDLCSDTTNDAEEGEWISLFIDSDNSKTIHPYFTFNMSLYDLTENASEVLIYEIYMNFMMLTMSFQEDLENENGTEALFYNVSSEEDFLEYNIVNPSNISETGSIRMNSTVEFDVAIGFSSSPNSPEAHRIFEFNIPLVSINNMTATSDYGIFIEGYGTMMSIYPQDLNFDFYTLPDQNMGAYALSWIVWEMFDALVLDFNETNVEVLNDFVIIYLRLGLAALEGYYWSCGPNIHDLFY